MGHWGRSICVLLTAGFGVHLVGRGIFNVGQAYNVGHVVFGFGLMALGATIAITVVKRSPPGARYERWLGKGALFSALAYLVLCPLPGFGRNWVDFREHRRMYELKNLGTMLAMYQTDNSERYPLAGVLYEPVKYVSKYSDLYGTPLDNFDRYAMNPSIYGYSGFELPSPGETVVFCEVPSSLSSLAFFGLGDTGAKFSKSGSPLLWKP